MSLEERRAERRRRRQMEEENLRNGTMSPEELQADIEARLARRRKEREERMAAIAANVSAVNGEDDLERRRRERRESRLKAAGGDTSDDYSSRRARRQRDTEENSTEDTSSYRSRRRRGYEDEEATPTYNDTSATDDAAAAEAAAQAAREEQRRREREEEEAEARRQQEREEAEERRRQEQAEARRREEEEDRRREEERLRRKQEADAEFEALEAKFSESCLEDDKHTGQESFSEDNTYTDSVVLREDSDVDKLERVRQWNEGNNTKEERNSQKVQSESGDHRNKISDKLNKFEQLKDEPSVKGKEKDKNSNYLQDRKEGLKNRLNKFEKEIQNQTLPTTKDVSNRSPKPKETSLSSNRLHEKLQHFETQAQKAGKSNEVQLVRSHSQSSQDGVKVAPRSKLKDIQQRFENGFFHGRTGQHSALLNRWSASETNLDKSDSRSDRKKNVLDRWKPPADTEKDLANLHSPSSSSSKDTFSKRLSGNTEFITSRFIEKIESSASTVNSPNSSMLERSHSLHNGERRRSSQSSETPSDCSDRFPYHDSGMGSRSKVADRWQHHVQETSISPKSQKTNSVVHSRGSSFDNSYVHSRGSSYDASSDTSLGPKSPVAWRKSQLEQEEEARLEQQRLEEERERQEEEARMAAEEEKKKKKGKRKGLGGLSPDKKKKLKDIQVEYDTEEEEEKRRVIAERLTPLPDDFDFLSTAELKKLCKQLHDKLAQFESDVYDWEFKVEKQELEVNELTLKVNDSKGKFCKPVLRKTNKTDAKFAKMKNKKVVKEDFRENLKSTGQSKFGLDEEEEQREKVLRARNLVGKLKGKTSAKVTDVFVTIALGKEKFQTSTIKYGGKLQNSVEWFEECDLFIPDMGMDVELNVMNRGLLSDEFIGYVPVPLNQFGVYERPESRWLHLQHKPTKLPDGRFRGEIEVRLTFHVKSKSEIIQNPDFKKQRAPSLKSLVTAVGDKFKFTRSRSFRGDSRSNYSSPDSTRSPRFQKKKHKTALYSGDIAPSTNSVNFPAVDVYVPNWNENDFDNDSLGDGNFARSYSLTQDRRRREQDFKSRSMFNLPSEHSMTFPPKGRRDLRPSLDDSALQRPASRGSVVSQDGYLESMFRSEREMSERMNETFDENIEEESEGEHDRPRRKSAQKFDGHLKSKGGSDSLTSSASSKSSRSHSSDSDKEIVLPKVKLKDNARNLSDRGDNEVFHETGSHDFNKSDITQNHTNDTTKENDSDDQTDSDHDEHSEHNGELGVIIAREKERKKSSSSCKFTLDSQGSSEHRTSSRASSSSSGYKGITAAERAYERGSTDSFTSSQRRKISPDADFSFTGVSHISNGHSPTPAARRPRKYVRGGRRYTIQGLDMHPHRSAPDIRAQRPVLSREQSVPEDLMAVYRNMNREELIRLVVTHKAQIIRKDQYIKDLEKYIDDLLVRVMETTPKLLQTL